MRQVDVPNTPPATAVGGSPHLPAELTNVRLWLCWHCGTVKSGPAGPCKQCGVWTSETGMPPNGSDGRTFDQFLAIAVVLGGLKRSAQQVEMGDRALNLVLGTLTYRDPSWWGKQLEHICAIPIVRTRKQDRRYLFRDFDGAVIHNGTIE